VANGLAGVLVNGNDDNVIGGTAAGAGNVISGNTAGNGIWITNGGDGNIIQGNLIGTNPAGTVNIPNVIGVNLNAGASNTVIGGSTATSRNVFSGNTLYGVHLADSGTTSNVIQGNYVGTTISGATALPNGFEGVRIASGASGNTVGGTAAGEGNVLSGNGGSGLQIIDSTTSGTTVQGNIMGLNAAGTAALPNVFHGISIVNSPSNTIGGTAAGAGNTISGNQQSGIQITGSTATGNTITGNMIGTDATGLTDLGNSGGVLIQNGASGNTVGGTTIAARNIISGNTHGVFITAVGTNSNTVIGNYIGVGSDGVTDVGNTLAGVSITEGASSNTIGGPTAGARNVISGNNGHGVSILGSAFALPGDGTANNRIIGNFIGTDATGLLDVGNGGNGVFVEASVAGPARHNRIGGLTSGERNVISGNAGWGVQLSYAVTGTQIQGNYIGVDATGDTALGNSAGGVVSSNYDNAGNTIGGVQPGAGNVISGNIGAGIGLGGDGTRVQGNIIGLNAAGLAAVPNTGRAITSGGATNWVIGGDDAEDGAVDGIVRARNIIAGNAEGVAFEVGGVMNGRIQGNYFGTAINGNVAIANGTQDIALAGASGVTIGGTTPGAGNVIGKALTISSLYAPVSNVTIAGNLVGLGADGTTLLGSGFYNGIELTDSGTGNAITGVTIGGTSAAARNVIGGMGNGILMVGANTSNNTVLGNYIGTSSAGTAARSNQTGIRVESGAHDNTIGGTTAAARNIISGNTNVGVYILAAGNTVQGNLIGTNANGTAALPNSTGVRLQGSSNLVGGTTAGARNVISGNLDMGVSIAAAANNQVYGNYIGTDITGSGAIPNVFGVRLTDGANNNHIGSAVSGSGNLISGNSSMGIHIGHATAPSNFIQGNLIGTNATGSAALANQGPGVFLGEAQGTTVGGTAPGEGNVISGNAQAGVVITGASATGNLVIGNVIGLDRQGENAVPNATGVQISGSPSNTIGGTTPGERNIISGNLDGGVYISHPSNTVTGNYFGTDSTGMTAIPNRDYDIRVDDGTGTTQIGGLTATPGTGAGNLFAGMVWMYVGNGTVQGNTFGLAADGVTPLGRELIGDEGGPATYAGSGVHLFASSSPSTIGGTTPGAGNVFGGTGIVNRFFNGPSHIHVFRDTSAGNVIQGNYIGTDITGTIDTSTAERAILLDSVNNQVGGGTSQARNIIAGTNRGIEVNKTGNTIEGNWIGLGADGQSVLGNDFTGILDWVGATTIRSNVITGNGVGFGTSGIYLFGSGSTVTANTIGTTAAGSAAGNYAGIALASGATSNTIGGSLPGQGNTIANSTTSGLRLEGSSGSANSFTGNIYFGNLSLGIDAGPLGPTLNDAPDADGVLNYPVITGSQVVGTDIVVEGTVPAGHTARIFVSAPSGNGAGQGQQLLASVLDDSIADENPAPGQFRIRIPIGPGVNHGTPLTALTLGSTSEFSPIVFAGEVGSFLAPQITLGQTTVSLVTGNSIDVEGSFYDPDSIEWTATVNYGDGSGVQPLTLNADRTFRLQHQYSVVDSNLGHTSTGSLTPSPCRFATILWCPARRR
jgi:hypothetical protein